MCSGGGGGRALCVLERWAREGPVGVSAAQREASLRAKEVPQSHTRAETAGCCSASVPYHMGKPRDHRRPFPGPSPSSAPCPEAALPRRGAGKQSMALSRSPHPLPTPTDSTGPEGTHLHQKRFGIYVSHLPPPWPSFPFSHHSEHPDRIPFHGASSAACALCTRRPGCTHLLGYKRDGRELPARRSLTGRIKRRQGNDYCVQRSIRAELWRKVVSSVRTGGEMQSRPCCTREPAGRHCADLLCSIPPVPNSNPFPCPAVPNPGCNTPGNSRSPRCSPSGPANCCAGREMGAGTAIPAGEKQRRFGTAFCCSPLPSRCCLQGAEEPSQGRGRSPKET